MLDEKEENESDIATTADVRKEMEKPRMARSARIAELNLDTTRIPEQPSVSMPGTVDKIIPSPVRANRNRHRLELRGPIVKNKISALKIH
jgi:hypothetical protein